MTTASHLVTTMNDLETLYEKPYAPSLAKEIDHINPHYRALIEASPFMVLATCGPEGLDCSPRGDPPGFVRVRDEKTLLIPDRRGNNRIDSLRNLIRDPRVALLFLIPGVNETMRIIGHAAISTDPELLRELRDARQTPALCACDHRGPRLFSVRQGLDPLEALGSRDAGRASKPTHDRPNAGRDQLRQARRR